MFSTEISILLNTENISILKFNNTETFGIIPENTELSDMPNDPEKIQKKKFKKKFWKFILNLFFSGFFQDHQAYL